MELETLKIISPAIALLVTAFAKLVLYTLNLPGEKEKHIKEHLDLIKNLPSPETVGSDGKTKLLYEEAFSMTYKEPLSFNEIKTLLKEKTPRSAITKYLDGSPYIKITPQGTFRYAIINKIRFDKYAIPFPIYRTILGILYTLLTAFGIWLLNTQTPNLYSLPSLNENNAVTTYINSIGLVLIGLISFILGIKVLIKFYKLPLKGDLLKGIHRIDDNELVVIQRNKTYRLIRKIKVFARRYGFV